MYMLSMAERIVEELAWAHGSSIYSSLALAKESPEGKGTPVCLQDKHTPARLTAAASVSRPARRPPA
jgi:hypothetical protein